MDRMTLDRFALTSRTTVEWMPREWTVPSRDPPDAATHSPTWPDVRNGLMSIETYGQAKDFWREHCNEMTGLNEYERDDVASFLMAFGIGIDWNTGCMRAMLPHLPDFQLAKYTVKTLPRVKKRQCSAG